MLLHGIVALKRCYFFIILIIKLAAFSVGARKCTRYPLNIQTSKSPVDDNFIISIAGNPQTYILGQIYNVTLHTYNGYRFINAKLALETEDGISKDLGRFIILDDVATHYSPNCVNMIETTNTNPKNRVDVQWVAPSEPNSGCILIRATVLQYRDIWHMDDGGLTKRICEEIVDDVESQKKSSNEELCCACDEARYEITFESLWSRNLHPKDFPNRIWTTRFSYIMGASHSSDYRFWNIGELATPAMQEFAEHGSTQSLENDFNESFKMGKIRTILKAKGPGFPNLNGYSLASIRTDPIHHQLSLAAKLEPSPDWFVGVTGLQLCLTNCTWLKEKNINLYPWDVGTDAGSSYTSPDQPQIPPDVIRRTQLDDSRSPFYDVSGVPMKPLAVLKLRRQRTYERKCLDEDSNHDDDIPRECHTHPWSGWSKCSTECGDGIQYRYRAYKQPEIAKIYNCDNLFKIKEERSCQGNNCGQKVNAYDLRKTIHYNNHIVDDNDDDDDNNDNYIDNEDMKLSSYLDNRNIKHNCDVGPWSLWSGCNNTCGEGRMTRTRQYIVPQNQDKCQKKYFVKLNEFKSCFGHQCLGDVYNPRNHPNNNENKDQNDEDEVEEYEKLEGGNLHSQFKPRNNNVDGNDEPNYYRNYNYNGNALNRNLFEAANLQRFQQQQQRQYKKSHRYNTNEETAENQDVYEEEDDENDEDINASSNVSHNRNVLRRKIFHMNNEDNNNNSNNNNIFDYCYKPLQLVNCADPRVIGNYWFYNICSDECMLYAADICDRNLNRFNSLEKCQELCKWPLHRLDKKFMRQKQSRECQRRIQ